jgi:hypothetical protein
MQAGAETTWRAFNLVGQQSRYPQLDRLPRGALADGEWRRVTWDMARAIGEQLAPGRPVVHNIIFGSWEEPREPVRVEFRNVSFCKRRTLD